MTKSIIAKATLLIAAPTAKVWNALIKPQLIKKLDAEIMTDWQAGSLITYTDTRRGRKDEGKGKVLQLESGKLLMFTFWNSAEGLPDLPENYKTVQCNLCPDGNGTRLTITFSKQTGNQSETNNPGKSLKLIPVRLTR